MVSDHDRSRQKFSCCLVYRVHSGNLSRHWHASAVTVVSRGLQEYVRRQNFPGTQFATTPTQLERDGDFSQTRDINGAVIPIKDPTNGQPFSGNVIPKARFNSLGLAIMNFFPLPNYTESDPNLLYRRNYRSNLSGNKFSK